MRSQDVIDAKVPILRVQMGGKYANIQVEMNVNNKVAVLNTHMLYYYAKCACLFVHVVVLCVFNVHVIIVIDVI